MPHLDVSNLGRFHTQCVHVAPPKHQDPPGTDQEKNSNHKSAPLPRRGSLVVDATGQNCQTGKGAMFARDRAPKVGSLWGNLKILRSARHRPNAPVWSDMGNIGSICGQIRPTRPQHSNFGPSWGPHGFKMVDMAGPRRNPQNTRFHLCFPLFLRIDDASCWTCLRWAQLGAKLSSKGPPSCATLGMTCTSMRLVSHGFKLRSIRIDLDSASAPTCAQRAHNVPCWTPSGLKLGPCLAQLKAKGRRSWAKYARCFPPSTRCNYIYIVALPTLGQPGRWSHQKKLAESHHEACRHMIQTRESHPGTASSVF